MKKINAFIKEYGMIIVLILSILMFFRTCSISNEQQKITKQVKAVEQKVDSIPSKFITKADVKQIMETTVSWESLVVEELSDKNKVPVNELRYKYNKK